MFCALEEHDQYSQGSKRDSYIKNSHRQDIPFTNLNRYCCYQTYSYNLLALKHVLVLNLQVS